MNSLTSSIQNQEDAAKISTSQEDLAIFSVGSTENTDSDNNAEAAEDIRQSAGANATEKCGSACTASNNMNPPEPLKKASVRDIDLSHDALAQRMGQLAFDRVARYVAAQKQWYFWDDDHGRWFLDTQQTHLSHTREFLRKEAKDLVNRALIEARAMKQDKAAKLIIWAKKEARNLKNRSTIDAVASLVATNSMSVAQSDHFDRDPLLLGTPGLTVDLRTGTIALARPEDLITKCTACAPGPEGAEPSLWLKFLNRAFDGDQNVITFLQRLCGYSATGLTTEHKFFFLYGSGRNGKSVFLDTLRWLFGDYATTTDSSLLMASRNEQHPTGLAKLQGARLAVASEIPRNATWNEARLKDLTGGEVLSARVMRGDFFDFKPQLTLMIAGNDKPRLNGVDTAMRARMVLVPFNVTIPEEERDPNLADKLKAEGPAILRWAIEGAIQWQNCGLAVPSALRAASVEYLDDEDTLKAFLEENTFQDQKAKVRTQELYEHYRIWCQRQGIEADKRKSFVQDLSKQGFSQVQRNTGMTIPGLQMIEEKA
ncbi:phage/plasmid primase, P4 family [Pararhodobacter sp. CCB-MM2]|uniref:DNA primase family protein n=1 Tax=Pararhodobacter sp. CCB-MM2 TaxID=1786003 RepID=UPI000833EE2D|nr:phage/plasmid primase, P4 family [Pararhodobacter sp. CCB-MM2]